MPRLPRFRRFPAVPPIQITKRDRFVIQLVNQHRFLRSTHLALLLGTSSSSLLRRLQLLYHHGFLERPRAQLDYYHRGGSKPIVYGLGNKGAKLLKDQLGLKLRVRRWNDKNRDVGRMFLEHALLVSDVLVAMEMACRKSESVRFIAQTEVVSKALRWKVALTSSQKLGVVPDAAFALEFPGRDGNRERACFFLEADRGTMPVKRNNLCQTSFYRKLLAYQATWTQNVHRARFGWNRFRMLTVSSSGKRLTSLLDASRELPKGHGLFLFASTSDIANQSPLFDPVWQSPRHGLVKLIELPPPLAATGNSARLLLQSSERYDAP